MGDIIDILLANPVLALALLLWLLPALVRFIARLAGAGGTAARRPGRGSAAGPAPRQAPPPRGVPRTPPPRPRTPRPTLKDLFPELFGEPPAEEPAEPAIPVPPLEPRAPEPTEALPRPRRQGEAAEPTEARVILDARARKKADILAENVPFRTSPTLERIRTRLGSDLRFAMAMHVILSPPKAMEDEPTAL